MESYLATTVSSIAMVIAWQLLGYQATLLNSMATMLLSNYGKLPSNYSEFHSNIIA
jgi:hypothetical protein